MQQGHGSPASHPTFQSRGCASTVHRLCCVCCMRTPRATGVRYWGAVAPIICRPAPFTAWSRAGAAFSQAWWFEAALNMNIIQGFCLVGIVIFSFRFPLGWECMGLARKWTVWQLSKPWLWMETDCMVCIKVQAREGWGLSMHQWSGSMLGQAGNKVWDACSTEKSWTSCIVPVVTPPELTFIFSWGRNSQVPLSPCFASSCYVKPILARSRFVCIIEEAFSQGKVKSLVYFPTILNFKILGEMYIYRTMSTIINIVAENIIFCKKILSNLFYLSLCLSNNTWTTACAEGELCVEKGYVDGLGRKFIKTLMRELDVSLPNSLSSQSPCTR